jgi:serine/threonine protein kinase
VPTERSAIAIRSLRNLLAERRLLARLGHPNIARLLDAGSTDDATSFWCWSMSTASASMTTALRTHSMSKRACGCLSARLRPWRMHTAS